jgi:hypothetical protein
MPELHRRCGWMPRRYTRGTMTLGNVARVVAVLAACIAAVGSASSSSNQPAPQPQGQVGGAPPPQQMEPGRALGLWRSTFGAVKIEADNSKGGLESGAVQGVWVYQRQGQEVVGYFSGSLRGNVLQFRWQEPNNPPLTGEGYLVFDLQGRQYSGRWWSDRRDRVGDWNGWRQAAQGGETDGNQGYADPYRGPDQVNGQGQYGGQSYGYAPQPPRRSGPAQPAPPQPAPPTYY